MKQLGVKLPWSGEKASAAQAVNLLKSVTNNCLIDMLQQSSSGFLKRGINLKASGLELEDLSSTPSTVAADTPKDFIKHFLA